MNIFELNKKMLKNYTSKDFNELEPITRLKEPNLYDEYLVVCALCNYSNEILNPFKKELFNRRLELFDKVEDQSNYLHSANDYIAKSDHKYKCKNLNKKNKYHLHEYQINTNDKELVNQLWAYKSRDCLKYVAVDDKITVSIGFNQLDGFIYALDDLNIDYDLQDIYGNLRHDNKSNNKLVDLSKLDLPFEPYDYQIEDAHKIVGMKRALLGGEMGTGKTFVSILVGASINTPKLVICPESLRLNWQKEILSVFPEADVNVLYSNEEPVFGKDWTIVGYHTAVKYQKRLKFKCVFIDEAHNMKSVNSWGTPSSSRAKAAVKIALNAEYCYLLTGTPIPSHNVDLFNILKMLKINEFDWSNPWTFKNYGLEYCAGKETYFGWDYSGNSNSEKLHHLLDPYMIRRLKKDVLPNLSQQRKFIPIKPELSKEYKDIEHRLYFPTAEDTYMGLAMTGRMLLGAYKLDTAIELAENILVNEKSVVIVTNFVSTADQLKIHFGDKACEIRGGMSDTAKQQAIDEFQSKQKTVCILNMQAGGVGITLTAASNMIMIDFAWTPGDNIQAEQRINRPGQNEMCNIYYVYCENAVLDRVFVRMLTDKSENISRAIDNTENQYDLTNELKENSTYISMLKDELSKK